MANEYNNMNAKREKKIEEAALNAYNESLSHKVKPQNKEHNARMEGFARKEEHLNN